MFININGAVMDKETIINYIDALIAMVENISKNGAIIGTNEIAIGSGYQPKSGYDSPRIKPTTKSGMQSN